MAEQRIAIACALRGYIQIYAITAFGLDEIAPKNILPEHSPIKSLTACDTLGIFSTLNSLNEIMVNDHHHRHQEERESCFCRYGRGIMK